MQDANQASESLREAASTSQSKTTQPVSVNKSPTPGSCNTVSIQEPAERNKGVFSADRAVPEVVSVPHTQTYATVCAQFKSFLEGHEEQFTRSYAIAEVVRKNGDKRRKRAIDDFNESISLSNLIFLSLLSAFNISSEFWLTLNGFQT